MTDEQALGDYIKSLPYFTEEEKEKMFKLIEAFGQEMYSEGCKDGYEQAYG